MLTKVTNSMISGQTINVFDYLPKSEHAGIQAGTSSYDCTDDIAAAIAAASAVAGDPYGYEKVVLFPQGWYNIKHIDLTARRNVWLYTDGYVILKGINSSPKNFIFGSTNYNLSNPGASTQTAECFVGGPGVWELNAAPGTSYQYGLRLEHFTSSYFENVSAGFGYVTMTDTNSFTGDIVAAYMQYTYSNIFMNCSFSCPSAPPVGGISIGLAIDNNNINSNTFIRCNWQGANATSAPYVGTVGVFLGGSNNVWDNCDLSALEIAFFGGGRGIQIRNPYSEYVTNFLKGPAAGTLNGCVVHGGIVEIINSGSAFVTQNMQNLTIIGGYYKGAFAGTKTFLDQAGGTSPNSLYGVNIIGVDLNPGDFAVATSGVYRNPDALAAASILQAKWLTFPSTAISSTDPNTLDDYEEGTWVPTQAGVTFASAYGAYTKVGNLVTLTFKVTWPVTADTTPLEFTSLPFSAVSSKAEANGMGVGYNNSAINVGGVVSSNILYIRRVGTGVSTQPTNADFSGKILTGSITFTI